MNNTILLLRGDDRQSLRHGGMRQYRTFHLYINGIEVRSYHDDEAATGYDSGKYLDERMKRDIFPLTLALGCQCVRGELKLRLKLDERGNWA